MDWVYLPGPAAALKEPFLAEYQRPFVQAPAQEHSFNCCSLDYEPGQQLMRSAQFAPRVRAGNSYEDTICEPGFGPQPPSADVTIQGQPKIKDQAVVLKNGGKPLKEKVVPELPPEFFDRLFDGVTDSLEITKVNMELHQSGLCRPCAFMYKDDGCRNGFGCRFCHYCDPGEKRRRKRSMRALAKQKSSAEATAFESNDVINDVICMGI